MTIKIFLIFLITTNIFADDIFYTFPWLNDSYGFIEEYDTRTSQIIGRKAGCYPIGNGLVFGSLGIFNPINTIDFICGPVYDEPFFGTERLEVLIEDIKENLYKQSIRWVKDTDIIVSRLSNDKVSLHTIDFAPPLVKSLIRIFVVQNISSEDLKNIKLVFKYPVLKGKSITVLNTNSDLFLKHNDKKKGSVKFYKIGFTLTEEGTNLAGKTEYSKNETSITFDLKKGESFSNIRYLAIDFDEKGLEETINLIKLEKLNLLLKTKAYWNEWLKSTTKIEISDLKIKYLIETQKIILKCQQSHSGGFSPMSGYTYTWVRDNNGPLLYMLRIGRFKEAKDILDFFYEIASKLGFVSTCISVNALSKKENNNKVDLNKIGVPNAEVPTWIVKQHWWYYTYTGDLNLLKERFPYLKRCLFGQDISKDGRLKFQTDETYMWTLQGRTYNLVKYPNYYLGVDAYSSDSAFEWVSASENLAKVAKLIGAEKEYKELTKKANFIRESIDKYYWLEKEGYYAPATSIFNQTYYIPHANIGLNPIWVGYSTCNDEKAKKSLFTHLTYLLKDDFLMKTTPNVEIFTGMVPGMLLYNLTYLKSPFAEKAYNALVKCASPSGDFFELYNGKGECWVVPHWGDGNYGRVRPWEGGINIDALLFYLTGFLPDGSDKVTLTPSLPKDVTYFTIKDILFKNLKFNLLIREEKSDVIKRIYEIVNTNQEEIKVELNINIPDSKMLNITVNSEEYLANNLKIEKEIPGNSNLKVEVTYIPNDATLLKKNPPLHTVSPVKNSSLTEFTLKKFKPQPYYFPKSDIVLLTTQDKYMYYVLSKDKKVVPVDMQLPLLPRDVNNAIYDDEKKIIKTKILLLSPKIFSIGPIHWKTYEFWYDNDLVWIFKKYLRGGGIILVMSPPFGKKEGYEIRPKWLVKLLEGGVWKVTSKGGKIVPSDDFTKVVLKKIKLDTIKIGDNLDEKKHNVMIDKKTDQEKGLIARSNIETRKWKEFYECEVKTEKGTQHNITITASSNSNCKNLRLEVKKGKNFSKVNVASVEVKEKFTEVSFILPSQYVESEKTTIRVVPSKPGVSITATEITVCKLKVTGESPLAELLGFKPNQIVGNSSSSLYFKDMIAPLRIIGNEKNAVLVMKDVDSGIFIRTELNFQNTKNVINSLLNDETKLKVVKYLQSKKMLK